MRGRFLAAALTLLKTDPNTVMQFIEQLAVKEKRELTEFEREQILKLLQLAHDKQNKQNEITPGIPGSMDDTGYINGFTEESTQRARKLQAD